MPVKPFHRLGKLVTGSVAAVVLALGLIAGALQFSSPASARSASVSCNDAVTSAPTGRATVSATSTRYGKVLVVGSGDHAGCSLYVLTSDAFHARTGAPFACSNNDNPLHAPCDSILWPALLTSGAPLAGPGINPTLLGTVTRNDVVGGPVQQVTYNGLPLYRFIFDEDPGETEGANLFDPITSPTGTWYLVDPSRGRFATGQAQLQWETAPVTGGASSATVLAARMNNDFGLFQNATFPVYTLSADTGPKSACEGLCALFWQPVLTDGRAAAGPNVDQHAVGVSIRADGSHQVTYKGKPLYLFIGDAFIAGLPGVGGPASINGAGLSTPFGVFNTIPAS